MSSIHLAKHLGAAGFEKTVALKTIRKRYSNDPQFVQLFTGEAKLVADLVHENIVQVYHLGKHDGRYFIAMEYVDGVDLGKFIDAHLVANLLVNADIGAFVISRICRGLEYAHNKRDHEGIPLGIVHRDISPRNIMINYEGVVKLADFGIAKARRGMEQHEGDVLLGKASYMSPEQARRETTNCASDLFSLGSVMYELLTGVRAFRGIDVAESLLAVQQAAPPPPSQFRANIPAALLEILDRALARDATDRFASAGEMGQELERFLYQEGYGPTNVTLGRYVRRLLLGIDVEPGEAKGRTLEAGVVFDPEAQTIALPIDRN